MSYEKKVIPFDKANSFFSALSSKGKRLVQCHGTFDLLHSGHIRHLQESKSLGDVLIVTITSENFVNKGPGRPFFNDTLRIQSLAELHCVDYVVSIPYPDAVEAIKCVKPHHYCKGMEYSRAENDVTGNIHEDVRVVKELKGQIHYIGTGVMSSTKILNNQFPVHAPELKNFCKELSERYSKKDFIQAIDAFQGTRVVVIGEIIFDKYSYINVQGLASKNRILSARFIQEDIQPGGALAVYRHLKEFTDNARLISVLGTEPWVEDEIRRYIPDTDDYIERNPDYTTIVKQRFIEKSAIEEKERTKLFSVNYLSQEDIPNTLNTKLENRFKHLVKDADIVLVMDFGHGLLTESLRELIQKKSPFLALNCQTNSNNYGFNIINQRYARADSFSLDEQEILLASGKRSIDLKKTLKNLATTFNAQYGWLTRGTISTLGLKEQVMVECPPLERNCLDAIGAGDAFCSLTTLAAYKQYPIDISTFLGQLAGAQAVRIVGNSDCIKKSILLKSGLSLITY